MVYGVSRIALVDVESTRDLMATLFECEMQRREQIEDFIQVHPSLEILYCMPCRRPLMSIISSALNSCTQCRSATWNLQCNWPEHVLRTDERPLVRQVLLKCIKPAAESISGDLIESEVPAAMTLAQDRIEWKKQ